MADTDLVFSISAQDAGYTQRFNEAYALITRLTTAEREYTATTVSLGTAQEIAAAKTRIMEEAERKVFDAIARSNDSSNKYAQTLDGLKNQYATGQITQQQYTAGLTDLAGGIKGASEEGSNWAQTLTGINQGLEIAEKAIGTFKQVWDFAKEGAQIERIQTQFGNAAQEMGLDAETLMGRMQAAVHGTVDDEELASISTRALTENLVTSGDQIVQALELARAASIRFGGTTQDRFEQIIRSADMLSTRGFKQLGIIVGDTKTIFENYSITLGKSADALTDEEKKQALLNTALEKGQDLIRKVGSAAEDTTTKMQRFETRITDIVDSIKAFAATGVSTGLDIVEFPQKLSEAFLATADKMRDSVAQGTMSLTEYNNALSGMADNMRGVLTPAMVDALLASQQLTEAQADNLRTINEWGQGVDTAVVSTQRWTQAQQEAARIDWEHVESVDGAVLATRRWQSSQSEALAAQAAQVAGLKNAEAAWKAQAVAIGETIARNESLAQSLKKATDEQAKQMLASSALEALKQKYAAAEINAQDYSKAVEQIEIRYGLATPQSIAMANAQDQLNQALSTGRITTDDYILAIGKVPSIAADGRITTDELTRLGIQPLSGAMQDATTQTNSFINALRSIPHDIDVNITVHSTGATTGSGTGTHGGTGGEQAQYGADFIVPMNPRGGMGDYFPVIAAPGERVQVTPAGETRNAAGVNVSINIGSTSASAAEIQAVVFDTMTQVMREAAT